MSKDHQDSPTEPIEAAHDATQDEKIGEIASIVGGYLASLAYSAFAVLAFSGGTFVSTFMPVTWYRIQTQFGLELTIPFGIAVAIQLFTLRKLDRHPDPRVRRLGRVLSTVFQYTALFQGLLMTSTILWIGAVFAGWDTLPTSESFPEDFVIGVGYVSCFIYGAVGGTALTGATNTGQRLLALAYFLIALAGPIVAFTAFGDEVQAYCDDEPVLAITAALVYFLIASVAGMAMMEQQSASLPIAEVQAQALAESGAADSAAATGAATGEGAPARPDTP